MSTARLAEDDAERPHRFGMVGAGKQELRAADDHRQGIIELVAGPSRELAQGFQLSRRSRSSSLSICCRIDATTVWTLRSSTARSATMAAHDSQARCAAEPASPL